MINRCFFLKLKKNKVQNNVFYINNEISKSINEINLHSIELNFYPGRIGLHAAITVVLAFNFDNVPALIPLIVYYSIASKIEE